jgi:hypothetical protein
MKTKILAFLNRVKPSIGKEENMNSKRTFIIIMALLVATFIISLAPAFAQVDTAWVRRYNGPGNANDGAKDLAVDTCGNIYVTGDSWGSGTSEDYATIKYDRDGDIAWVRRYNGPASLWDYASAIALDASNNVCVTGYSLGSGTNDDYVTIKYDPTSGDTAWVRTYNGPVSADDHARAITADTSNNVYVTGGSFGIEGNWDYATIKYYPGGDTAWVRRYNGSGNSNDSANAIVVDDSGNVYVTGGSWGIGTREDYSTIKYYSNGDTAWVRIYNGPGNWHDEAYAIAVDDSGNVYVTGWSGGIGTGEDYATIKYDPNGDTVWVRRYNGPENDDDEAFAIAVDDSCNVYVTGSRTIKYSSGGDQQWVGAWGGGDIVVDDSGNVYVTGSIYYTETHLDYVTAKYYSNGNTAWVQRYNGPANAADAAFAIGIDDSTNVYVTGGSVGILPFSDYATIKYISPIYKATYRIEEPPYWYQPPLRVTPSGSRTLVFKVFSIGNTGCTFSVTSDHPCIQVNVPPTVLPPGDSATIPIIVSGFGACNNTFIDGNVILTTNEGGGKYDTMPVQAVVANDYYECPIDSATVETLDNEVLRLYTNANCEERIFDIGTFPDTIHEVFFDGGTIIATTREDDTLVGRYMGTNDHKAGVRDKLYTESCSPDWEPDFWIVYTKNIFLHKLNPPMNPKWFWWEMSKQIKIFKSTAPDPYKHLVIKYITVKRHNPPTWWPSQPTFTGYEDTYLGVAMDINCPSDTTIRGVNSVNFAGYDATNNIAYQRGFDYAGGHPEYNDYYCGIALAQGRTGESTVPYGAYNVNNNEYLYPQNGWGWKDGELYQLAANPLPVDIQDPYSAVDRSWVFTATKIPAGNDPYKTTTYTVVEVVAPGGLSQLRAYVDTARAIVTRERTYPHGIPVICGDVTGNGVVDLGDLAYMITYGYKNGPPPPCPISRMDVTGNGIVDLGDIVYFITYQYKGGPALRCPGIYGP